jgi:molybdopterin molybdotransferase
MTDSTATVADPGCQSDFDPASLSVAEAVRRIRDAVSPVREVERLPIREALDRVLAEDIRAGFDVPPHANSAMDGFAVRSEDVPAAGSVELEVIGTAWAGRPLEQEVGPGRCARIMTGAVLPAGCDTVVIKERVEGTEGRVRIPAPVQAGDNVRAAGEDIRAGSVVLTAGRRLGPAELGLLASLGIPAVEVLRRIRVAFFSTGDELRGIGERLAPGQIYDSNRYTLFAMLRHIDAEIHDLGVVPDRRDATEAALQRAAAAADAVLTSGGVSAGEADFVTETLRKIGEVGFWKVAMKPGRPLAFGRVGDAWFFGLPGNPVSVMVTFYQFVRDALLKLAGRDPIDPLPTFSVPCTSTLKKAPGRTEFQRGILSRDAAGALSVRVTGEQGSGILRSMSEANCFIILPTEQGNVTPGTMVEVQVMEGVI